MTVTRPLTHFEKIFLKVKESAPDRSLEEIYCDIRQQFFDGINIMHMAESFEEWDDGATLYIGAWITLFSYEWDQ